jgi:signal transduction histidine kinase
VAVVPILGLGWFLVGGVQPGLGWGLPYKLLGLAAAGGREGRLVMLGLGTLGVPYLAGLTLRYFARAEAAQQARQTAETDARAAQEIARLQEEQNRLARDVHDVVGHSLTVILAQAESAQYIDDPDRLKRTMKTIATSARASLQDVRQVLTPGQQHTVGRGGLDELIEAVQASGHRVVATAVGTVRPLPPELDAVAYRVLQEMLTNAIKHGRRDEPIVVERHWPDRDGAGALRIVVRNTVDADARTPAGSAESGQGLVGMQRRLESVGGRFDVQQREEPHGHTFTATALVPVRSPFAGSPV